MKIKIIAICNLMGRPLCAGEIVEPKNLAEEEAAQYLISIEKAKDITPVIATDVMEEKPVPNPPRKKLHGKPAENSDGHEDVINLERREEKE